jgi:hypothetical protein
MPVKFFELSFKVIHSSYSFTDVAEIKYEGHDDYVVYLHEISECQSKDLKEALTIVNTAKGAAKKSLELNLKQSLKKFDWDSDHLHNLWQFDEVRDLYNDFFGEIKVLFGIKIEIKGENETELEDGRGNPNFKKKKLPSEVLFSIVNKANELIQKHPDLYTPKPGKKTNTALTIEIFQYLEKKYKIDRINSYFRKEITLFGDRFCLHPPSGHTNSKKIVVY